MDLFGKLNEARKKSEEIKAGLANVSVKGDAGSGKVTVVMDGNRRVKSIEISNDLLSGDKEELEDLLIIAINKASDQAEAVSADELKKITQDLLPGFNL